MSGDDQDYPDPSEGFPHRQMHPVRDVPGFRNMAQEYVAKLLDLEAKTHPQNKNPADKDADSRMALAYAASLVDILAGWALDHHTGLVSTAE